MKGVFKHWMRNETGNFRLVVSTLDFDIQKNENTEISRLDVYQHTTTTFFTGKNSSTTNVGNGDFLYFNRICLLISFLHIPENNLRI